MLQRRPIVTLRGPQGLQGEVGLRGLDGLPGVNAVAADTAVAAYLVALNSQTGLTLRSETQTPLGVPVEKFLLPGEVFDYTGTYDMSPILNRAISTVSATFRPVQILVGPGRVRIGSNLNFVTNRKGIGLRGAGKFRTIFDLDPGVLGLMVGYGDATTYLENIHAGHFTVDCSRQVADANTSLKAFNLGHIFNSTFTDIRVLNSWATAFGIDYPVNVEVMNCDVYNAGRGLHTETVLGSGASFGIAVGARPNEWIRFFNCRSFGAAREGWNLEWLTSYSVDDFKTKVTVMMCLSDGDSVGIADLGTKGIQVIGTVIQAFKNAGMVIGTGGQAPRGGRGGFVDGSTIIRQGVKGGRPDQDVYGGHGIVIRGDDTAGGYEINARIEDCAGDGINFEPGFRLGAGGLNIGAKIRRCGGAGVRMYGGAEVAIGVTFRGMVLEGNKDFGLDLRTALRGLVVAGCTFIATGVQTTAIRFDQMITLDAPSVRDNNAYGTTFFMTGQGAATNPDFANNRSHKSIEAQGDQNLIYFRTMKTIGDLTGISSGWTGVVAGSFTEAGAWKRSREGLEPVTNGTYHGYTLWAYNAAQTGAEFFAIYDPKSTGSAFRGIAISVNPATGEAIVLRAGGSGFYQLVTHSAAGGEPTVVWDNVIPSNEKHEMGLYRPAGGNLVYVLIDGIVRATVTITTVPETTRVGVYGQAIADSTGLLYNIRICKPATAAAPVTDLPPGFSYFNTLSAVPTVNGPIDAGWSRLTVAPHAEVHDWPFTANGASPVTTDATHGGTGWWRAGTAGKRVTATVSTPDVSAIGVRGIAICVNDATGDMIVFRVATSTGDYEIARYVGGSRQLVARSGNFSTPVFLTNTIELGLSRDAGTNTVRAYINGVEAWSGSVSTVPETPNVAFLGNASGTAYLSNFGIAA